MRFSPAFLDEIRARIPVSEVVGQRVKLKKQGREWRGLSPFQPEKTPSFYVNDQKGFFHDFSSGKHGDGFAFLMETEGLSFPEAVERLAAMAGLPVPVETQESRKAEERRASLGEVVEWAAQFFEKELRGPAGAEARVYLARRGIDEAARAHFRLGYAPPGRHALRDHLAARGAGVEPMIEAGLLIHGEDITVPYDRFRNRIMFPICDRAGRVIAFGGRAMEKDAQAKYLNSPETPLFHKGSNLYNMHNARKAAQEAGSVIAVEGYVDVIAMTAAGFPHTVAPLGTALTPDQCGLLWRMAPEPILCFDGDKAGRRAAYRAIDAALPLIGPGRTFRFALLPDGQDPDDLYRSGGASAVAEAIAETKPLVDVLWAREIEGRTLDAPERRAALERRLSEVAATIADNALRRHYSEEFSARLASLFGRMADRPRRSERSLFRRPSSDARERSGPLTVSSELAGSSLYRGRRPQVSPREALILLILMNHPTLLANWVEETATLDFDSRDAEALKAVLVRWAEEGPNGPEGLAHAIERAGLAALRAKLGEMTTQSSLWCVRPEAATADAARALRQAFTLHRRARALHRELRNAEADLAADPSDHNLARLRDIQAQLSALDGTEATVEGFGSMSGRVSRAL